MARRTGSSDDEHALDPALANDEQRLEASLRPRTFEEYVGQGKVVEKPKVYVKAAKARSEALDHCLFSGPLASARRRWRTSSPRNWAWPCTSPAARRWRRRAISPAS